MFHVKHSDRDHPYAFAGLTRRAPNALCSACELPNQGGLTLAMDYSAYEFLKVEVAERVATVTINRPEVRNAVHAALHHEFEQIWIDLAEDHDVNAILLTGAGNAFSVGGDITSRDKPSKS